MEEDLTTPMENLNLETSDMEDGGSPLVDDTPISDDDKISNGHPDPTPHAAEIEGSVNMQFSPPVYIQRYYRVSEILHDLIPTTPNRKTVMEVGCAEFSMHVYLSKMPGVEKIIYLDLDEKLLIDRLFKLKPLVIDYILKREAPLVVEAYAGCVTKVDPAVVDLPSISAVLAIEIVEHLDPDILEGFVKSVFGVISPPTIIVTTPNSDFNVHFNMEPGKFRHWDHRFEWTRDEFTVWCSSVSSRYQYTFTIEGVGAGPPETEGSGCVSQLAVFRKVEGLATLPVEAIERSSQGIVQPGSYKLLNVVEYPFLIETATADERILREFNRYVTYTVFTPPRIEEYIYEEVKEVNIPLNHLLSLYGMPRNVTVEQIQTVLEFHGFTIVQGTEASTMEVDNFETPCVCAVVQVPELPEEEVSSSSEEEEVDQEPSHINGTNGQPYPSQVVDDEVWD